MARERTRKKGRFAGKTTANAHKQKSKGSQYGHLNLPKGVSVFKETPGGRCQLNFLPYEVTDPMHPDRDIELDIAVPGELWYKRPYKMHRNVGVNNESAVCPTSFGKKCPICEYRAKLLADGADWQDETVKACRASDRNLYVVVPLEEKDYDEKPHIWDISQFLFQDMLNDELEENEDYGEFPDLEDGYTLRIRFSKETFGKNEFAKTSRIDFEDRPKPYPESILKQVPNLDEVLSCPGYDELHAKFFELETPTEEQTETVVEEDSQSTRSRRRIPRPEPEPEEEDPSNEEDVCIACKGSGTNSKGRVCRICEGTGIKPVKEGPVVRDEKPESTTPSRRRAAPALKTEEKDDCPFGHEFGTDCEEFDDCDTCDKFEECLDAKEAAE
jgi:hypothetical protein